VTDTLYDSVPYQTLALPQTHPDRLAVMAVLFGKTPRPIDRCRVLELACGSGHNLIPMAYGLPGSEFVGLDLAETAIHRGVQAAADLGLANLKLVHANILDVDASWGLFDYIIAHGVYSWVPANVQEHILSICKNNLAPQGVAYVSYNTFPGWHMRSMAREIMRFHAGHFDDPGQKIQQARGILQFVVSAIPPSMAEYGRALARELKEIQELAPELQSNYIFHDQLAELNQPFYFHQFMKAVMGHGLKYLAEAEFFEMQSLLFDENVQGTLARLAGSDILIQEQFMDFLKGRKFRQTLLHHADEPVTRSLHPGRMRDFHFSSMSRPVDRDGALIDEPPDRLMARDDLAFKRPKGASTLGTDHIVAKAALILLSQVWPERLSFDQLLAGAMDLAGPAAQGLQDGPDAVGDILLSAFSANIVEAHVHAPRFARTAGQVPKASAVARLQARSQTKITSLCHKTIELAGTIGPWLLPLLDGARNRAYLAQAMADLARRPPEGFPIRPEPDAPIEAWEAAVATELGHYGRHALLEA
jgi:SAM-dependent methyltransferase